jgi:hypothetical protein
MRVIMRQAFTFGALLLLLCGTALAESNNQAAQLAIAVPPDGIYLGEPLIVRVSIRNIGIDTLRIAAFFDPPRGRTAKPLTLTVSFTTLTSRGLQRKVLMQSHQGIPFTASRP